MTGYGGIYLGLTLEPLKHQYYCHGHGRCSHRALYLAY